MITDLRLQNFRSYSDSSFELNSGVNIIVGPNASGKTNLLEAILVLSKGSSYRASDSELVKFDKAWARLDCDTSQSKRRTVKIQQEPIPNKNFELDNKSYKRMSSNNQLATVLFEPNHLQILSGGPERRRAYIDETIALFTPGYPTTLSQYKRSLAQRNRLLKANLTNKNLIEQIFPWDLKLSQLAGQIVRERNNYVRAINGKIADLYKDLSKSKNLAAVSYKHQWKPEHYESNLLKKLEASVLDDRLRGYTGNGPHREDVAVYVDAKPMQETASRGEARTLMLALKIIELQTLEDHKGQSPILLLDDVFSELDGRRRHALTDYLSNRQTFITTTDADLALKHFNKNSNVLPL